MRVIYIVIQLCLISLSSFGQEFLKDGSGYIGVGIVGDVKKSNFYGDIKREVHPVTQMGLSEYKLTTKQEFTAQTIVSLQTRQFKFAGFDNYGSGTFFFTNQKYKNLYLGAGLRGAIHLFPNPNAISTDPYSDSVVLSATSQSAAQIEIGYGDMNPTKLRMIAPVFGFKMVQGEKSKYQLGARTRLSMNENLLLAEALYSKNLDSTPYHDVSAFVSALVKLNKLMKKVKLPVDVYAGLDARITGATLKTTSGDVVKTAKSNAGMRLMVTFK